MDINGALSSHYSSPALTLITPPINPSLTQRPLKSAVTYRLVATADGVALKLVELRLKFIKAGAVEGGAMVKARDGMAPPGVGERPPHISLLAITRPRGAMRALAALAREHGCAAGGRPLVLGWAVRAGGET